MWLVNFYLTLFTVRVNGANPAANAGWNQGGATAGRGRGVKSIHIWMIWGIYTPIPAFSWMSSASYIAPHATSSFVAPPAPEKRRRNQVKYVSLPVIVKKKKHTSTDSNISVIFNGICYVNKRWRVLGVGRGAGLDNWGQVEARALLRRKTPKTMVTVTFCDTGNRLRLFLLDFPFSSGRRQGEREDCQFFIYILDPIIFF